MGDEDSSERSHATGSTARAVSAAPAARARTPPASAPRASIHAARLYGSASPGSAGSPRSAPPRAAWARLCARPWPGWRSPGRGKRWASSTSISREARRTCSSASRRTSPRRRRACCRFLVTDGLVPDERGGFSRETGRSRSGDPRCRMRSSSSWPSPSGASWTFSSSTCLPGIGEEVLDLGTADPPHGGTGHLHSLRRLPRRWWRDSSRSWPRCGSPLRG